AGRALHLFLGLAERAALGTFGNPGDHSRAAARGLDGAVGRPAWQRRRVGDRDPDARDDRPGAGGRLGRGCRLRARRRPSAGRARTPRSRAGDAAVPGRRVDDPGRGEMGRPRRQAEGVQALELAVVACGNPGAAMKASTLRWALVLAIVAAVGFRLVLD